MKEHLTPTVTFHQILAARERLRQGIGSTPCTESAPLSGLTGSQIFCKRDYLQPTGSFKERGARNALSLLSGSEARRGVVAASAGNHALGLAWHARALGVPITVVMPLSAARVKIDQCRRLGAEVLLEGGTFDHARSRAATLAMERGIANIHPFDDPAVIAGQGTIALEVLEQIPQFDAIIVPVGGGGLLAGVAVAIRASRPWVSVIGVEPENAPCFSMALKRGLPITVPTRSTLADGLAVARAGSCAFRTAAALIDRIVTVSEQSLALAVRLFAETEGAVVEGAAAAPLAALLSGQLPECRGKRLVLLLTGRNIDPAVHDEAMSSGGRQGAMTNLVAAAPRVIGEPARELSAGDLSI